MSVRKPTLSAQVRILRAGTPALTVGAAQEQIARLNGYASWNVAKASEQKPALKVAEPPLPGVAEIDVHSCIEYDTPDTVAAWRWIEQEASFAHKDNGVGPGVWEFLVRAERLRSMPGGAPDEFPPKLKAATEEALAKNPTWVLFYQD